MSWDFTSKAATFVIIRAMFKVCGGKTGMLYKPK